ncbi:MAG TPA: SIS domain-containing protein [Terriglobales bacterium]|nr:SIS domain-containing protein [Terriglobales bacterium]
MSAQQYLDSITQIISKIRTTQAEKINAAGERFASSIAQGGRVYLFGSGHSVLPVLDVFPRYGSFVGFYPIYDPRLMWFNVIGPGGARELLWLERQEGYARIILASYQLGTGDSILIFSHGGLNAVPVEMAMVAREMGAGVVSVSSLENYRQAKATHSSTKKLADVSEIAIDNCVPPEDALVAADGIPEKFAAGSTVAAVSIAMSLVAEVGVRLVGRGERPLTFVSPNVGGPNHNEQVFQEYARRLARRNS